MGVMEASFKCYSRATIMLTNSIRSSHQLAQYHPWAPIITVTHNCQMAHQAHLYRSIFPMLCKHPVQQLWAEEMDVHGNLAMNVGKAQGFFKTGVWSSC